MKRTAYRQERIQTQEVPRLDRGSLLHLCTGSPSASTTGYEASLERHKINVVLTDRDAERDGDLRVVDESGEDYLFSAYRFVSIAVPAAVEASLLKAHDKLPAQSGSAIHL
jgi:hypothetical protein